MKTIVAVVLGSMLMLTQSSVFATTITGPVVQYEGCDGVTAAVAINDEMFVVASPNDNVLRVYARTGSVKPLVSFDLSDYLEVSPGLPSLIQGATRVGDRVYWITSHGRDEEGRIRPERYRFFATTMVNEGGQIEIQPVGRPAKALVHRLVDRHTMRTLRLDKATRFGLELKEEERRRLAPSRGGLNIAALCASHNAEILMALRNPRPLRVITGTPHALIVPLDNADEVIEKGEDPIFGEGILLDLAGRGIAGFEYSEFHAAYFFVAPPPDTESDFVLYRWSGMKANPPKVVECFSTDSQDFFPDTVVPFEHANELLLLGHGVIGPRAGESALHESDTGSLVTRSFRGCWLRP
ncbi:MAG: hypothetical protein JSW27_17365 [Phycisphaerales bacterium]|nr:MAG: hypothetical protein JSW27_17365 [Phycisphaerales bacterium]